MEDQRRRKLTGIIDFGDVAIDDPDYDLMYLFEEFGEEFIKRLLKYYKQPGKKR